MADLLSDIVDIETSAGGAAPKAGFMLDFGEDGPGSFVKYLRRGSGYYIDVGASALVADKVGKCTSLQKFII